MAIDLWGGSLGTIRPIKSKTSPAPGKPLSIKCGNVTVKVYAETNRVNGTDYEQFTLAYYDGAKRRKKRSPI